MTSYIGIHNVSNNAKLGENMQSHISRQYPDEQHLHISMASARVIEKTFLSHISHQYLSSATLVFKSVHSSQSHVKQVSVATVL